MNNEALKSNLTSGKHWLRLVYMLLFALLLYVAGFVVALLAIVQFFFSLFTGQDNLKMREFASSFAIFIHQALKFLTYVSEDKPFPFADWPVSEVIIADVVVVPETEVATETVVVSDAAETTEPEVAVELETEAAVVVEVVTEVDVSPLPKSTSPTESDGLDSTLDNPK